VQIFLAREGSGQVGCGDAFVPVTRNVPPAHPPLTAALRALLSIEERAVGASGLTNALWQSDLQVADIERSDGIWQIFLSDQLRLTGVCDGPRVSEQLHRTALQFDTVREVAFFVNGEPLDSVISQR
jgi:hypothetical protein